MVASGETLRTDAHAYTVLRGLGQGGQSRVYLVEREGERGSRYVLKLLRMEHVEDWKQVELFERQVQTLADLEHPGIPRLVDRIVEDGRTAGIVETYVDGPTLAELISKRGALSPERFEQILRECLDVLVYLHERVPPVLHRDIKPSNVMLGPERAHVIDFSAVRVGGKSDMTSVGTFGYMAPEQIIGRAEPGSDMYGLGMTMIALAERCDVGDLPHDQATGRVEPTGLMPSVDPRVRAVVLDMIEPGLASRLSRPREALRRLDASLELPAVAAARAVERAGSTHQRMMVAAGVAVAAMGVAVITLFSRSSEPASPPPPSTISAPPVPVPAPVPAVPPVPEPEVPPPSAEPAKPPPPPAGRAEVVPHELTEDNSAELVLTTSPPGATAHVLGERCTTPCTIRVSFGEHSLRFVHEGKHVDRRVNVLQDTKIHVSISSD
jgi:serine/threonine protein kinase